MGNHDHCLSLEQFHLLCWNSISIKRLTPCFLLSPDPGNRYSTFCLCEFDCVPYLSGITQYLCRFVSGLFHLASCPWGLSTLKHVSECHSYRLSVNGFPVCVHVCIVYTPQFVHLLTGQWVFRLFPPSGHCEQCCCGHWWAYLSVQAPAFDFGGLCTQTWTRWMRWEFCLILWGVTTPLSTAAIVFYLPLAQMFQFSTSSPALVIICLSDNSHLNRCESDVSLWPWFAFP